MLHASRCVLLEASREAQPRSFIDDQRPKPRDHLENTRTWQDEFAKVCPKCASVGLPASDFRYSPGWVTLWHAHAARLLEKEELYDDAFAHWGWSRLINGIPDESYWSTLLYHFRLPITGKLTTYMEGGDAKSGHSYMFSESNFGNNVAPAW